MGPRARGGTSRPLRVRGGPAVGPRARSGLPRGATLSPRNPEGWPPGRRLDLPPGARRGSSSVRPPPASCRWPFPPPVPAAAARAGAWPSLPAAAARPPPPALSSAAEGRFPTAPTPPGSSRLPRGSRCRHRERARGKVSRGGRRGGEAPRGGGGASGGRDGRRRRRRGRPASRAGDGAQAGPRSGRATCRTVISPLIT